METRALTIRQPWATLIMLGRKRFETRSKTTTRRGRVFIHAATTMGPAERAAAVREGLDPDALPRGAILGSVEIVASIPAVMLVDKYGQTLNVGADTLSAAERRCGDFAPGRWAWKLEAVEQLPRPVPCAGALSFWEVPGEILSTVDVVRADARVFVYGTLKHGHPNHRLLRDGRAVFGGEDQIAGAMHDLGGFPAVHLGVSDVVHGEVYTVDEPTLARLDRLEGHPSFYQRTRVRMSSGRIAWAYVMEPGPLAAKRRISSGRWERRT